MNREQTIAKLKALNLPDGSYIVFGASPLAILGIREAEDVDLMVSKEQYAELKKAGWRESEGRNDIPIVHDVFEAHDNWDFDSYNPTLQHLLATAIVVDGIPFASLEEVRKWKSVAGRPRDLIDIGLIDEYFSRTNSLS